MNESFSIHYRFTKKCNANCDYCSSAGKSNLRPISVSDFKKTIDFLISQYLPQRINLLDAHITLNYLGGEILTVKKGEFIECVEYARSEFNKVTSNFRDGIQSNLIGNPNTLAQYRDLFGNNIGTSVDNTSDKRNIGGSSERYRKLMNNNIIHVFSEHPPATLVVDDDNVGNLMLEYKQSVAKHHDLTLRPIIQCGSNIETKLGSKAPVAFFEVFKDWHLKGVKRVEPFYSMLSSKVNEISKNAMTNCSGCHMQNNCTQNNVNIDPDGDIYLCNEMADGDVYKLGNAITGVINEDNLRILEGRLTNLPLECIICPHYRSCRGGCMYSALESCGSIEGKDPHCAIWKPIFEEIDFLILNKENYIKKVTQWLKHL